MAGGRATPAPGLIGVLVSGGSVAGLTDEQLLARFVAQREAAEFAFEALVRKYGPMVLGVCRGTLGNRHEADDAFQTTFLVLARKASSLREPARLGAWLYGVALRSARKVRTQRARRQRVEQSPDVVRDVDSTDTTDRRLIQQEETALLVEEIGRLPERDRVAVVLSYFEGLTQEDIARQLGWPVGTVGVRLMRARARLRERLTRRGVAPAGLASLLLPRPEPPATALVAQTAEAALRFALGTASSPVAALAAGVIRTMTIKTIMLRTGALVTCGLLAAGASALAVQAQRERPVKPVAAQETAKAGENAPSILANGGVEQGDAQSGSPQGWNTGGAVPGVKYQWDRTVAHQGRASLHLRKTAARYIPIAQWTQEVKRTGSAPRLKVSAFVKAEKMTKAILDVQFLDKDGKWSHAWAVYIGAKDSGDPPATHDWKRLEGVVAIPEGTEKLIVAPQIYGPGDVWFDDLTAEYTDAPAVDPTAS